jgi:hypothetical protein
LLPKNLESLLAVDSVTALMEPDIVFGKLGYIIVLDIPKSQSYIVQSSLSNMFSGLMSLCIKLAVCMKFKAHKIL